MTKRWLAISVAAVLLLMACSVSDLTSQFTGSAPQPPALVTYDDAAAPFTIQYPDGWKIREESDTVFFQAPDQSAAIQVTFYEYPEGAPKGVTAQDVFERFTQIFAQNTGLKIMRQSANADGSISADIEFKDPATGKPLQGFLRVALAQNRQYHFTVIFAANQDQFARLQATGAAAINSFQER